MVKYPKVYVLILNYNGWADTIECLESVLRSDYPNYQVIIIDNNSSDNSTEYIKAWAEGKLNIWIRHDNPLRYLSYPPVEKPLSYIYYSKREAEKGGNPQLEAKNEYTLIIIQTGDNLGYAGGNNIGIKYALARNDFEYIWILNNDTVIDKESLSKSINATMNDKFDRLIGSYVWEYDEPGKLQLYGGLRLCKYFILRPFFAKENDDIDCISGVSLFLSRKNINKLGLLEEKYFLNSEDLEYSYFYSKAFRKLHNDITPFLVAGKLWHKHSASQDKNVILHAYYLTRNTLYFSLEISKINFSLTFISAILRGIYYLLICKRDTTKGIFLGIKDFVNKKTGKWSQHSGQKEAEGYSCKIH